MVPRKLLLLLLVPIVAFALYGISGCIHGEHDDTPLTITTTSLPPGQAGAAYDAALKGIGGKWPYTWSVETGANTLPPGLYLSESGNITGTPTTEGSYAFTIKVTDSDNDPRSVSINLSIVVYASGEVSITTAALAPAYVSEAYEGHLQAVGGETPYVWSIVAGGTELITGLYLSDSGNVTGTPTAEGVFVVEVRVDEQGVTFDTKNITITVYEPKEELAILSTSPLPDAVSGVLYDFQFDATGGYKGSPQAYEWGVETGSAPLPPGLVLDTATGSLSGIPGATPGTEYSFSIILTDFDTPRKSVTKIFKLTVN